MLFSLAMKPDAAPTRAASPAFARPREERCLRHRVWRRTRHPRLGAAERRAALLVNVLTRRELANCGCYRVSFQRSALTSLICSPRFERMLFFKVSS